MMLVLWWVAATTLAPDGGAEAPATARPLYYQRAVTDADLTGRSREELALMRNTIYARAGRRFKTPKLRDYFARQPWYHPAADPVKLGAVDSANVRAIIARERAARVAALPPIITSPCTAARSDGTLIDKRDEDALVRLAGKLPWTDDYGFPGACERRVTLTCGPDLDGDGQPESIARLAWLTPLNEERCAPGHPPQDYWENAKIFLVSGRVGRWRAVEPLGITINGDQQNEDRDATFVRRADGTGAIDLHESVFDGGNGCQWETDSLFTLRRGTLERIETVDRSPACNEQ